MYLAQRRIMGQTHYFIRESYKDRDCWRSRELIRLGPNPARYIVYPGGNAFYIDEVVEERLASLGARVTMNDMEDVFWPFIEPEIRRITSSFREKEKARRGKTKLTPEREAQMCRQVCEFDKRRIHYLRSGRMDQAGIGRMPVQLYRWLFEKSRDEIEQRFMSMERCLGPRELKNYAFVIFDLQRFFTESWAKKMPQGLNQETVDEYFIGEICCLNNDSVFWLGEKARDALHEYLIRYVIMFFDNSFGPDSFLRDYVREFMDTHRAWRFPQKVRAVSLSEASSIFGVKKDILAAMSKRSLVRLFRRLAQKLHPDKGGTHEEFIRLTEAYRELLRTRNP